MSGSLQFKTRAALRSEEFHGSAGSAHLPAAPAAGAGRGGGTRGGAGSFPARARAALLPEPGWASGLVSSALMREATPSPFTSSEAASALRRPQAPHLRREAAFPGFLGPRPAVPRARAISLVARPRCESLLHDRPSKSPPRSSSRRPERVAIPRTEGGPPAGIRPSAPRWGDYSCHPAGRTPEGRPGEDRGSDRADTVMSQRIPRQLLEPAGPRSGSPGACRSPAAPASLSAREDSRQIPTPRTGREQIRAVRATRFVVTCCGRKRIHMAAVSVNGHAGRLRGAGDRARPAARFSGRARVANERD